MHCDGLAFLCRILARRAIELASFRAHAVRSALSLLSFQLLPYPWFRKQQAPLYPHIRFPDTTFAGISTDRGSEGNAKLVTDFVRLNSEYIGYDDRRPLQQRPGLFLDMQSVSEAEIGPCGRWRGLTLLPCGVSYRALRPLDLRELLHSHLASREALRQRDQLFQLADSDVLFRRYPEGS